MEKDKIQSKGKSSLCQISRKSSFSKKSTGSKLKLPLPDKNNCNMSYNKRSLLKSKSGKAIGSVLSKRRTSVYTCNGKRKNSSSGTRMTSALQKVSNKSKKQKSSVRIVTEKASPLIHKGDGGKANVNGRFQNIHKKRKQKRKKENTVQDEASRLQRRTRYLLIKMKLEQNLIDAYSAEGWKGQSREKIKPEKELQRAQKQILECKLGIRNAIHQLELLSSEGHIEDTVISPEGSVSHENIFCAKCKLRDAFPDNDIILCDGTCNCAFHQKCLEPPLATENIPPGDQGWLCRFCECKMEILEAINAHLGTCFSVNSKWQDIFIEAASAPDDVNRNLGPSEEWPSDDSGDDDYDPEMNKEISSDIEDSASDNGSSSSGLFWSSDEESSYSGCTRLDKVNIVGSDNKVDSDDDGNPEINCRRQRPDVDYRKLHDEMFGKDALDNEQLSHDEDWGPTRRKRRRKEIDQGTAVTTPDEGNGFSKEKSREEKKKLSLISRDKRKLFRIPPSAVEKLRCAFAENELPSRAIKESLSQQLGIASEKVSKWFKNARYMALKLRKENSIKKLCNGHTAKSSNVEAGRNQNANQDVAETNCSVTSAAGVQLHETLITLCRRKKPNSKSVKLRNQQKISAGLLPSDVIEKLSATLVDNQSPSTSVKRKLSKQLGISYLQVSLWFKNATHSKQMGSLKGARTKNSKPKKRIYGRVKQLFLVELERLFHLEDRIEKLQKILRACTDDCNHSSTTDTNLAQQLVIYVPVAEVREKSA